MYSDSGKKHWLEIGQKVCGKDYWPEDSKKLDAFFPGGFGEYDARRATMLMMCPWRSTLRYMNVDPVVLKTAGVTEMGTCDSGMNIISEESGDDGPRLTCVVSVLGMDRTNSILLGDMRHLSSASAAGAWRIADERESVLYENLRCGSRQVAQSSFCEEKWKQSALYSRVRSLFPRVFVVNDALFCVLCYEQEGLSRCTYFVSSKTLLVLSLLRFSHRSHFIIETASIWILDNDLMVLQCIAPFKEDRVGEKYFSIPRLEKVLWGVHMGPSLRFPKNKKELFKSLIPCVVREGSARALSALLDKFSLHYGNRYMRMDIISQMPEDVVDVLMGHRIV